MSKKKHISVHIMGLFHQFNKTRFDMKKVEDVKLLERWLMRLSSIPDDTALIDKCFEPLYDGKRMPQPDQFLRIYGNHIGHTSESPPEGSLRNTARTPFTKALVSLIASGAFLGGGQTKYYQELRKLCVEHGRKDWYPSIDHALAKAIQDDSKKVITRKQKIQHIKDRIESINSYTATLVVNRKKLIEEKSFLERQTTNEATLQEETP